MELPIAVRISATEWMDEWRKIEDFLWPSTKLAEVGIDMIDVSTGGAVPDAKIPVGPGYQLPLASAIRRNVKNSVELVPLINGLGEWFDKRNSQFS